MTEKSVENNSLNAMAPLFYTYGVAVAFDQLTEGHPLQCLWVIWQIVPVGLHFHLPRPPRGVFAYVK